MRISPLAASAARRPRLRTWLRNIAIGTGLTGALLGVAPPAYAVNVTMNVPMYKQGMADDCEASSLRMILRYRGHVLTDAQIMKEIGVDLAHPQFGKSGPLSGDPYRAFVGNPNGSEAAGTGFGVYYPRIAAVAAQNHLTVLAARMNYAPATLYAQLAAGHPAVVWIDYLYRALHTSWYKAYDGQWIRYAGPNEHAIVLTGVTTNGVWVNDPARGHYWIKKSSFEAGYSTYNDMAVVIA